MKGYYKDISLIRLMAALTGPLPEANFHTQWRTYTGPTANPIAAEDT